MGHHLYLISAKHFPCFKLFHQFEYFLYLQKGTCRLNNSAIEARVNTFNYVAAQNAPAMQVALQKYGPLAVAMTVVNSFYNYA